MKKFVIGLGVIGIFALYSLGIRHQSPVLSKPSSLLSNNSSNASTASGSAGSSGGTPASGSASTSSQYKDGSYTGSSANAYYGNVQVSATISGGKITAVNILQYPNSHSTSVIISQQAMPYLQQEAVSAQSANVQIVSGATFTSQAFEQSLAAALSQAQG